MGISCPLLPSQLPFVPVVAVASTLPWDFTPIPTVLLSLSASGYTESKVFRNLCDASGIQVGSRRFLLNWPAEVVSVSRYLVAAFPPCHSHLLELSVLFSGHPQAPHMKVLTSLSIQEESNQNQKLQVPESSSARGSGWGKGVQSQASADAGPFPSSVEYSHLLGNLGNEWR